MIVAEFALFLSDCYMLLVDGDISTTCTGSIHAGGSGRTSLAYALLTNSSSLPPLSFSPIVADR